MKLGRAVQCTGLTKSRTALKLIFPDALAHRQGLSNEPYNVLFNLVTVGILGLRAWKVVNGG